MRSFAVQPVCLVLAAALLMAAEPSWESKPASQWTEEDANQILTRSPWVKENRATIAQPADGGSTAGRRTDGAAARYR